MQSSSSISQDAWSTLRVFKKATISTEMDRFTGTKYQVVTIKLQIRQKEATVFQSPREKEIKMPLEYELLIPI